MTTPASANDKLLRVSDVMARLSISRSEVYSLIERGAIRSIRLPGKGSRFIRRVPESVIANLIEANMIGAS